MSDHVETLKLAREQFVTRRREVARNLADEALAGQEMADVARFTALQSVIEAIDRAIEDEEKESRLTKSV